MIYVFDNRDNIVKNASKIIIVLLIGFVGYYALLHVPFLYSMAGHRIESMVAGLFGTDAAVDSSTSTRLNLIQWGIEWFKERMWFGYGIDNYRFVLHSYHSNWSLAYYAHNNYVELLVDVGLIGTIVYYFNYVCMLVSSARNVRKITKQELLFIGILVAIMISEYGLVTYYDKYIQVILFTYMDDYRNVKRIKTEGGKMKRNIIQRGLARAGYKGYMNWIPDSLYLKLMFWARLGIKIKLFES